MREEAVEIWGCLLTLNKPLKLEVATNIRVGSTIFGARVKQIK